MNFSLNLKINNISHSFDSKNFLFKNLNYEIESSEIIAITGPNGSGKSTLIKIIASLLKPSNGNIELSVNQNKILNEDFYLFTSLVSPYLNLYEEFTGLEHIKICEEFLNKNCHSERSEESNLKNCHSERSEESNVRHCHSERSEESNVRHCHSERSEESNVKNCHSERSEESRKNSFNQLFSGFFTSFRMAPKTVNQTIKDLLDIFELKKVANDPIRTYSSGQKQRLKYVLALLKEPLVCLFDEPFTNLDDNGINIAKQFIDNLTENKCIVIIASNDNREIELSNRKIELI